MKYNLFINIFLSIMTLNAQDFYEHIVTTNALDAYFVDSKDIDNDGDMDILSASRVDHKMMHKVHLYHHPDLNHQNEYIHHKNL